jgi:predicted permease
MEFRRRSFEAGLDKELRYHFESMVRDLIVSGMDPEQARRQARLEFGGMEQVKEECRDVQGRWLEDFAKDLRYTVRTLGRSPGFAAVAVMSLALGIGANAAIFSLINAVMLKSLPVREPEQLVQVTRLRPTGQPSSVSYLMFLDFRQNLKSVSSIAAEKSGNAAIVMDGAEELVDLEMVSGDHYSMLGLAPAAGRLIEAADDTLTSTAPAAVISFRYWERRFGRDGAAIGKKFAFRDKLFTIVGVTPPRYEGTRTGRDPDITLPLTMMLSDDERQEPTLNNLTAIGRLKRGATAEQADAEFQVIWHRFMEGVAAHEPAKDRPGMLAQRAAVVPAADGFNPLRYEYSRALWILMGIVGLVLLLACTNLAGLLLARAASRQRETAIRLAIGAGAGRLVRQFLTESLVLAVAGGTIGLLLSRYLSAALVTMLANGGKLLISTAPDWRVLVFTGAISLAVCVLSGLAPGLDALRANLNPGLRQARAGGPQRLGKALVVAQIAISMVLLTGATLFVGTVIELYRVDRGLKSDGVLMFTVRSRDRYQQARSWAVQSGMVDRLNALPEVAVASATYVVPIGGGLWSRHVQVEGYQYGPNESEDVGFNAVAPSYFKAIGTPLLEGREFNERDTMTAAKVAIVNERFARYYFGGKSPLGRHVTSVGVTYEIVGVARDAKYRSLRDEVIRTIYTSWMQRDDTQPGSFSYIAQVKAGDPMRLAPLLEKLVREADPVLRLRKVETYNRLIDESIVTERIMATLGGFFGALALMVACLGIFGVLAFQVSRRVNEIGVRMALGASRSGIVTLVLRDVLVMLAVGCAVGTLGSLALTGLTRKMLFGVTPTEPGVFATAAMVLGAAAFIAGWLPARRASRIDPMVALRHE